MLRLKGFDYKRPYFYMVTLKRLPELAAFSRISDEAEVKRDAEGRMLFLSLYAAMDRMPTKQELYHRCHEMGDIAVEGLNDD